MTNVQRRMYTNIAALYHEPYNRNFIALTLTLSLYNIIYLYGE